MGRMKIKVNPESDTNIMFVPSEDVGFVCAMLITNDYVDATLRLTENDIDKLIRELERFRGK